MVERVNPPPHVKMPRKIVTDPDREFVNYHTQITRILFQLWARVGGGEDDAINDVETLTLNLNSSLRAEIGSVIEDLLSNDAELDGRLSSLSGRVQEVSDGLDDRDEVYDQLSSLRSLIPEPLREDADVLVAAITQKVSQLEDELRDLDDLREQVAALNGRVAALEESDSDDVSVQLSSFAALSAELLKRTEDLEE